MRVVLTAHSPIQHGAFGPSAGNMVLIRRMTLVCHPDQPRVPAISGNALRGTLRRLVMRDLFQRAGLSRETMESPQWDRLYAALANGGHLEAAETRIDPDKIRALRESLPPLSVFGAALYSWMLAGHMEVGILWPRCRETVDAGITSCGRDVRADDLVEDLGHCRHVDREQQEPDVSGVTPMPTTMEVLCTGTVLESEITFARHAGAVEESVIAYALDMMRSVGGKSAAGLGRVDVEHDGDAAAYREWRESTTDIGDRLRALAEDLGASKRKKKAKT